MKNHPSDHEMSEFHKRLDRHYATMQSILARLTALETRPCACTCSSHASGPDSSAAGASTSSAPAPASASSANCGSSDPTAAIRADPRRPEWLTDEMLPLPPSTERIWRDGRGIRRAYPCGRWFRDWCGDWGGVAEDEGTAEAMVGARVYHVPQPAPLPTAREVAEGVMVEYGRRTGGGHVCHALMRDIIEAAIERDRQQRPEVRDKAP